MAVNRNGTILVGIQTEVIEGGLRAIVIHIKAGTIIVPPTTLSAAWLPFVAREMQLIDSLLCGDQEHNQNVHAASIFTRQVTIIQISVYIHTCKLVILHYQQTQLLIHEKGLS